MSDPDRDEMLRTFIGVTELQAVQCVRVSAEFPERTAAVAYRAVYQHGAPEPPAIELLTDFTNDVALMTLLPFLREAKADVTRRVFDQPLLMPLYERGQLVFAVPEYLANERVE